MDETAAANQELTNYRERFKAVVLKHIRECLSTEEWQRLRQLSTNHKRSPIPGDKADVDLSPEALFDVALSDDNISVREILLVSSFKPVQIGQIEEQPVYYIEDRGIYAWGLQPGSTPILMFWITHPAYPPGW